MLNDLNISNISRKSFFYIHKLVIYSSTILFFIILTFYLLNQEYLLSTFLDLKYVSLYILKFEIVYFFEIVLFFLLIINSILDNVIFKYILRKYTYYKINDEYIKNKLNIYNFHMLGLIHNILCLILIPTFHLNIILVLSERLSIYNMCIFYLYVISLSIINLKQFIYSLFSVKNYTIF